MHITQAMQQFTHQFITPDEMDIIQQASPLVYKNMDNDRKKSIFDAVRSIPADQRRDVIAQASILMEFTLDGQENAALLNLIKETPAPLREIFTVQVESLLYRVKEREIILAIEAILNLPASERPDVVARTLSFSWDNISKETLKRVFDMILAVEPEDRDDVIQRALPFLLESDGTGAPYILKAISDIRSAERDDVIARALSLFSDDLDKETIYCLLVAINNIPNLEREGVIELALPFMKDDMDAFDKGTILLSVQKIPEAQRKEAAQLALSLRQPDMTGKEIAEILGAVRRMEPLERKHIIELASLLLQNSKDKKSTNILLEEIQRIPLSERDHFVKIAAPFMRGELTPFMKSMILKCIERIPAAHRKQQTDRVLAQLKIDFPHGAPETRDYIHRLKELLETPFDHLFQPLKRKEAPVESKSSNRLASIDLDLGRTLLELRRARKMSPKEIQYSLKACIKYLEDHECHKTLKVLIGPSLGPEDFGPFLEPFIIGGVKTSGQEVIGRLWKTIEELPNQQMKELALRLTIDSLNKCINSDNIRISNEQKVLHLFFNLKKLDSYEY